MPVNAEAEYILYLGNDRPHCTERYVAHALREEGWQVRLRAIARDTFDAVVRMINLRKPKFVLFSKPSQPWVGGFIDWCRVEGVTTVCWQWDLYHGLRGMRLAPPQFAADYLFTTDGGHEEAWQRNYPHHKVLRQGIHGPHHVMFPPQPCIDVAFVGTLRQQIHCGRAELLKYLGDRYGDRFLFINNTRGLALNQLLSSVRVVVGDSYPSPRYWSNRIYEMLGRGACLVYPRTVGLDEEFTEGAHYVGFDRGDYNELGAVIDGLLQDEPRRLSLRQAGWNRMSDYTYRHRVRRLIESVASPRVRGE